MVAFDWRWREDFAALNIEWLQRWFVVEPFDREVLGNPEHCILADGGWILFAVEGEQRALGTVALMHGGDGVYELTKMAVAPEARGRGIGRLLMDEALRLYRSLDARRLALCAGRGAHGLGAAAAARRSSRSDSRQHEDSKATG